MNDDLHDILRRLSEIEDPGDQRMDEFEADLLLALQRAEHDEPVDAVGAIDTARLSRRVLVAASADLARNANRAWAERLARALAVALLPLPVAAALAGWGLPRLYEILATLLPAPVAAALVASYAALGVVAVATAYACLPVLTERMAPQTMAMAGRAATADGGAEAGGIQ